MTLETKSIYSDSQNRKKVRNFLLKRKNSSDFVNSSVKKKIGLWIDEEVINRFKEFIIRKYGRYEWGAFSREAQQALIEYISKHTNSTQNVNLKKLDEKRKVEIVFKQVLLFLKEKYKVETVLLIDVIPKEHLVEAIAEIRGPDPRTINKWVNSFVKFGYIEDGNPRYFRVKHNGF